MEAILLDPALRRQSLSLDTREHWDEKGTPSPTSSRKAQGVGSVFDNVMRIGIGAANARKNYSLAPCCHLFVSNLETADAGC
jgi:hypothetical protein